MTKEERAIYAKDWYRKNKEKVCVYQRKWRKGNRHKVQGYQNACRKKRPWPYLIKYAKDRANAKRISFDLTNEWAESRWTGKCEVSGLRFIPNVGGGKATPFSPSIDRLDPEKGYTQENCRFVIFGVNALKGTGTEKDLLDIARAITEAAEINE